MISKANTRKNLVIVAILSALLVITLLLWENGNLQGLFGTSVQTTGTVVDSNECGARRSEVCVELDLNREIVNAETNRIRTSTDDRVVIKVEDNLSRGVIVSVMN